MPTVRALQTVVYEVPDMQTAKEFYSRAFGCEPYFDQPFYIGYSIGGCELGLHPDNYAPSTSRNVVAYWNVEDIHSALQHFLQSGAELVDDVMDTGGEIRVAMVRDPFGNSIGLISDPTFRPRG